MTIKVCRFTNQKQEEFTSPVASIKKVRVVKPKTAEPVKEYKASVLGRLAKLRPLTEEHARNAWGQLFAEGATA